ncbi:MAG: HEPN domain-containing protein [Thermoflexales bacterium]|nr:HEPN domain-containing protein [Thermoflexales bacterium]
MRRARDWLDQAWRDLEHARRDMADGFHEWACFSAQQAAEKGLKALYQHLGGEARGHSVKWLLERLPLEEEVRQELIECARILDRFYIPTRYPNGFDYGKPADYYTVADSQQAIGCAERILRFCTDRMAE